MATKSVRTSGWFGAVILGLLVAGVALSAWRLQESQSTLRHAQSSLEQCRKLADEIQRARQQPAFISESPTSETSVTTQISQALQSVRIAPAQVVSIDPQPLQNLGDTGLRRQIAIVDLSHVTLEQTVRFLHALATADTTWIDTGLAFSTHGSRDAAPVMTEVWSVQVTLTRLSFSPITPSTP